MDGDTRRAATPRLAQALAAGVGVIALMLSVTHLALRLPDLSLLRPLPAAALVSYDRLLGEITPLSDDYIRRILGIGRSRAEGRHPPGTARGGADAPRTDAGRAVADVRDLAPEAVGPTDSVVLRHDFTNDAFSSALRPDRLPFVARTDMSTASREVNEPGSCDPVGGTAWYAYRPARPMTLAADTFGTPHATALAVFQGRSLATLEQVGCSRSVTGNAAVSFRAAAGRTYWFQVGAPAGGAVLAFSLTDVGPTSRASVSSDGRQSTGHIHEVAALSPDGRYIAFTANDYVLGGRTCAELQSQRAGCYALFVRDRVTGTTELLLHASPREPNTKDEETRQAMTEDRWSYYHVAPKFSGDGRYLTFHSDDPTLVPGDHNGHDDVYVYDRLSRAVERVSLSSQGREGTTDRANTDRIAHVAGSHGASLSQDGRYVAFTSAAEGLVPEDTNHFLDVFVRDRLTGRTERVSVQTGGSQLDGASTASLLQSISADGRYVVFTSYAPSISPQRQSQPCSRDTCEGAAFLHDRVTRTTTLLSTTPSGRPGNGPSDRPTISADGSAVGFTSSASDLVARDSNEVADTFWRDLRTGRTLRASVASGGRQQSRPPVGMAPLTTQAQLTRPNVSLSGDGRLVAFVSASDDLVAGDDNSAFDVFVHDTRSRSTARVSVSEDGDEGDGDSISAFLSADGRSVVFGSHATNLVQGDSNKEYDIFVHDSRIPGRA